MISLRNVTYTLKKDDEVLSVLDDLTVEIPTESAFGILGLEGSGKSILMRLLSGFLQPTTGEVQRHARLSFPIGYEGIFKRVLSPRDNLLRFGGHYGRQIEEIVRFVNSATGLGTNFDVPLGKLPADLQSRFVFAATYALPFDCYLVDERVAPSDVDFKSTCQRMMEDRARDCGIILATRRISQVQRYCRSAGVLDGGKLTVYERADDAIAAFRDIETRRAVDKLGKVVVPEPAAPPPGSDITMPRAAASGADRLLGRKRTAVSIS